MLFVLLNLICRGNGSVLVDLLLYDVCRYVLLQFGNVVQVSVLAEVLLVGVSVSQLVTIGDDLSY